MESRQRNESSRSPGTKSRPLSGCFAEDQGTSIVNSKLRSDRRFDKERWQRLRAQSPPRQQLRATAPQIPQTLVPLVPWAVKQDAQLLSGIGAASQCPVLVASLSVPRVSELPELPSLQHVDDELPYKSVVPQPSSRAVGSKKYHHPALERVDAPKGWVCKHTANHVRIISPSGIVLHSATVVRRTSSAVRREILELEMLMQGLVMEGSTCAMVRFQDEINQIRAMANEMVESTACRATKNSPTADPDYTGLRQFYREYDTALAALWARRAECVSELANLEDCSIQLDSRVNALSPVHK